MLVARANLRDFIPLSALNHIDIYGKSKTFWLAAQKVLSLSLRLPNWLCLFDYLDLFRLFYKMLSCLCGKP